MKIALTLLLCGMVALAMTDKVKYNNYKVFRVIPRTEAERKVLLNLEENNPGVVFWKHVRKVGLPVDIMIPPHLQDIVEGISAQSLSITEMINDVQSLIDVEALGSLNADPRYGWDAYYPVDEIHAFINGIAADHPDLAKVSSFGTSYEGRDLRCITLNKGNTTKPTIFVDANIHAREWITNTIATYLVNELVSGDAAPLLDDFNFVVVPMMNPDGYEYSRNTDRLWRKTRSNLAGGLCRGADPNRNWAFGWNTGGSSASPCSDTFMGVSAFSEPETKAASELLDSIAEETIFYLSLHSYSQLILIPYGTALGRVPDHQEHMDIGNAAAAAIRQRYGTSFTPGNIVELLYVASGASVDYMKGEHDTDLAYTFEMRDEGRYGFVLPVDQIIPSCLEFMDGFKVIADRLKGKIENKTYF